MKTKTKRRLQQLLAELRKALPIDKRPLVDQLERVAGEVRHEMSALREELQEVEERLRTEPAELTTRLSECQQELADAKAQATQSKTELDRWHVDQRERDGKRRHRESKIGQWFIGNEPASQRLIVVHLHTPTFVAYLTENSADILDGARDSLIKGFLAGATLADEQASGWQRPLIERVFATVRWLDENPTASDAEDLMCAAVEVALISYVEWNQDM